MERELGRLGHRPHEHKEAEDHGRRGAERTSGHRLTQAGADLLEAETAGGPEQTENAKQQAEVPDPVDHESFLGGVGGRGTVVPEANQQVGAHAHQLPEDIDLQQVRADHQPQHGTAEQGQIGEKPHIARVVGHVAIGINHHQQGDGGHQRQHHGREGIHPEAHLQVEGSGTGPIEQHFGDTTPGELLGKHGEAENGGGSDAGDQQERHGLPQPIDRAVEGDQAQAGDGGADQGQEGNQPGELGC